VRLEDGPVDEHDEAQGDEQRAAAAGRPLAGTAAAGHGGRAGRRRGELDAVLNASLSLAGVVGQRPAEEGGGEVSELGGGRCALRFGLARWTD
jgi:hypothetical protein